MKRTVNYETVREISQLRLSNWLLNIPTPETVRKRSQLILSNWLLNIPTPIKTAGREINYTKTEELARSSGFCREFLPNYLEPRELRAEIPSKNRNF